MSGLCRGSAVVFVLFCARGTVLAQPETSSSPRLGAEVARTANAERGSETFRSGRLLPRASSERSATPLPKRGTPEERSADRANRRVAGSSAAGSLWKTLGALGLVVCLILGIAVLLRKHGPTSIVGLPLEAIEVLGRRNLDQRESIVLVRCGTRIMILGSSAAGLTTLSEVNDPVEVDYLAGLCHQSETESSVVKSFRQLLMRSKPVAAARPSGRLSPIEQSLSERMSGQFTQATDGSPDGSLENVDG
ncbi:MAG: hypothetical protein CMJ48_04510 [Planctomycetaceae bacterium]|nr:hypothetical protein [Planctomycetaceae bacterium]